MKPLIMRDQLHSANALMLNGDKNYSIIVTFDFKSALPGGVQWILFHILKVIENSRFTDFLEDN